MVTDEKIQKTQDLAKTANDVKDGKDLKAIYGSQPDSFFKNFCVIDRDFIEQALEALEEIKKSYPPKNEYDHDKYVLFVNSKDVQPVLIAESLKDKLLGNIKGEFLDAFIAEKGAEYDVILNELNNLPSE